MINLSDLYFKPISADDSLVNDTYNVNDTSFINVNNNLTIASVRQLNQEFLNIGYSSIFSAKPTEIDLKLIYKNCIDLVYSQKHNVQLIERLQQQNHVLTKDNEQNDNKHTKLKEILNTKEKDIHLMKQKTDQLSQSVQKLNKQLKDEQDENRKLKSFNDQRDNFYKHDRKKYEFELNKLKDKLKQLLLNKIELLTPAIDVDSPLRHKASSLRTPWNNVENTNKKQIDMLSQLIGEYESRVKQLIIENQDLKEFVYELKQMLNGGADENILNLPFDSNIKGLQDFIKTRFHFPEQQHRLQDDDDESEQSVLSSQQTIAVTTISTIHADDDDIGGDGSHIGDVLKEKLKLETEKSQFNKALVQLQNERKKFENDKRELYSKTFYESQFSMNSPNRSTSKASSSVTSK